MDERKVNNEALNEEQVQLEQEFQNSQSAYNVEANSPEEDVRSKGIAGTLESIFTSPEGGFLGFAITLCIGYAIHAITGNDYKAKVKTPRGTEFSIYKGGKDDV